MDPPRKIFEPPRDQTDRVRLALMVSVLPSHTAPMLLYRPLWPPRESGLVTGPGSSIVSPDFTHETTESFYFFTPFEPVSHPNLFALFVVVVFDE